MARLLTLAKAARLLGITRTALQREIRDGKIDTFEGQILVTELERAYPSIDLDRSAMVERARFIKDNALSRRGQGKELSDPERLQERVAKLQNDLAAANIQLRWYAEILEELLLKMQDLQDNCNREQEIVIASITAWLRYKVEN